MQGKLKYRRTGRAGSPFCYRYAGRKRPVNLQQGCQRTVARVSWPATACTSLINYFISSYSNYNTFSILLDINYIHQQSRSFSKG